MRFDGSYYIAHGSWNEAMEISLARIKAGMIVVPILAVAIIGLTFLVAGVRAGLTSGGILLGIVVVIEVFLGIGLFITTIIYNIKNGRSALFGFFSSSRYSKGYNKWYNKSFLGLINVKMVSIFVIGIVIGMLI